MNSITLELITVSRVLFPAWDDGPGQAGGPGEVQYYLSVDYAQAAVENFGGRASITHMDVYQDPAGDIYEVKPLGGLHDEQKKTIKEQILAKLTPAERRILGH